MLSHVRRCGIAWLHLVAQSLRCTATSCPGTSAILRAGPCQQSESGCAWPDDHPKAKLTCQEGLVRSRQPMGLRVHFEVRTAHAGFEEAIGMLQGRGCLTLVAFLL